MKEIKELHFSGAPYTHVRLCDRNWNTTESNVASGFVLDSEQNSFAVISVDPDALDLEGMPISSVVLRLEASAHTGAVVVNFEYNFPGEETRPFIYEGSSSELPFWDIDVTGTKPEGSLREIYLMCSSMASGEDPTPTTCTFLKPELVVTYSAFADSNTQASFSAGEGADVLLNLPTGTVSAIFADVTDPVLGISVNHVYDERNGDDFYSRLKTNLHETLKKSPFNDNYVYAEATGKEHPCINGFYTINEKGERESRFVSPSEVTVDATGRLWNDGVEVFRELRTPDGLRATSRLSDVNDVEWIEQRYDEEREAEEQLDALEEHLTAFVLVRKDTGEECLPLKREFLDSTDAMEEFFQMVTEDDKEIPLYLFTRDDAETYRSLIEQRASLSAQRDSIEENARSLLLQYQAGTSFAYQKNANATQAKLYENERAGIGIQKGKVDEESDGGEEENYAARQALIGTTEDDANTTTGDDVHTQQALLEQSNALITKQEEDYTQQKTWIERQIRNFFPSFTDITCNEKYPGILTRQYDIVSKQHGRIHDLLSGDSFETKSNEYREELPKRYTEYRAAKANVEELSYAIPVAFLISEDGAKGYNEHGQLVTIQSKDGKHLVISWQTHIEGAPRRIASVSDDNDNCMTFRYDSEGRLLEIKTSQGKRVVFSYDSNSMHVQRSDCSLSLFHDGYRITKIVSNDSEESVLRYNLIGALFEMITTTTVKEISHGVVTKITEDEAPIELSRIEVTHDENTVRLTSHSPEKEEIYTFDEETEMLTGHYGIENGMVASAERYTFNDATKQPSMKGGYAKNSLHTYAFEDFLSSAKQGDEELYSYNSFYMLRRTERSLAGAEGLKAARKEYSVTEYVYNADGKPISVKTTSEEYDEAGAVSKTTVSYENTTYNSKGKPVRVERYTEGKENILGVEITETVYDKDGNFLRSYSYNSLAPSDKTYTESEMDESGRTVAEYDATGKHKTKYTYFADGSLASETLPNGAVLAYAYDEKGNQVSVTASTESGEGNTNITHYTAGLVTRVESGNHVVDYVYDGKRRLTKVKKDGEEFIFFAYADNADGTETVTVSYQNGTFADVFTRKKDGKLLSHVFGAATHLIYEYEADGKRKRAYNQSSDGTVMDEIAYTYDTEKRLATYTDAVGISEVFTYDAMDRNETRSETLLATDALKESVATYSYTYDPETKRVTQAENGPFTVTQQYDPLGKLKKRFVTCGNNFIQEETFSCLKHGDHATALPSETVYYSTSDDQRVKYSYDMMGNISKIVVDGIISCRYAYDDLGRLTREDNRPMGKTYLWRYDKNGNILSRYEWSFTLKSEDELQEIEPQDKKLYIYEGDLLVMYGDEGHFQYNAGGECTRYRGNRISYTRERKVSSYGGVAISYGTNGLCSAIGEATLLYDHSGNIVADSRYHYLYDHAGAVFGFKERQAIGATGEAAAYFYRKDALGNIAAILDNRGRIVVQYHYDAWGCFKVLDASGVEITDTTHIGYKNPFRYRGYYYSDDLGLYYLKSRFYDPEVGRFISADTVDYLAPDTVNGLNLYAYCGNNPVMNVDPSGCFWDYVFDAVFIVWSIYDLATGGYKDWENWVALGIDILFAVVPFVPSGCGQVIKAGNRIDNVTDLMKTANALDTLNDMNKVTVVGQTMSRVENTAKIFNASDNLYSGFSKYGQWKQKGKFGLGCAELVGKSQNAVWLYAKLRSGFTIVDIGIDVVKVAEGIKSSSYAMESVILLMWQTRNIWKFPINYFS